MKFGSPRDRRNPRFLRQQPRERHVRGRCALTLRDILDQLDQSHVGLAGLGRKARDHIPEVSGIEFRVFVDLACQESSFERAERDESEAKLLQCRQKLDFRAAIKQ
jgi:hypothetical protein